MNRISTLSQPSAGFSGAMLEEEGRTALDSAQPELTISQMSRAFGVSLRTLRFYEDRGLIKPRPARATPDFIAAPTASGWR